MILDRALTPWDFVGSAVLGLASGIISLFFGVGGGVIMVPALTIIFGFNMATATMISQSTMLFSTTSSAIVLMIKKRVDFKTCLWFSMSTIPGSIVSGFMATFLQSYPEVQLAFGILMVGLTAWKITLESKKIHKARKSSKIAGVDSDNKDGDNNGVGSNDQEEDKTEGVSKPVDVESPVSEQVDKEESREHSMDKNAKEDGESPSSLSSESSSSTLDEDSTKELIQDKDDEVPEGKIRLKKNGKIVRRKWLCCVNVRDKHQVTTEGLVFDYQIIYFPGVILAFFGRLIGGLFGLGGGIMFIPILTMMMGVPIELATGISSASIAIANPFTILVRSLEGDSDGLWGIIVICGVCTIVSVLLGGLVIAKVKQGALIIGFWILVLLSVIKMIYDAAAEMASIYGGNDDTDGSEEE